MSLMNIKTKEQSGFTIVELLIVVVVIAILAAITLVSFNNITNRANDSAAKETAANVQKKVELYNAENSAYPTTKAQLTTGTNSWTLGTGINLLDATATLDATNGKDSVRIQNCGAGMTITYWEFNKSGNPADKKTTINVGTPGTCANLT